MDNFKDFVTELGYSFFQAEPTYLIIKKPERISDVFIIVDYVNKIICGYLKPNDVIKELDDITHQYKVFRVMKEDLKNIAAVINYEVM